MSRTGFPNAVRAGSSAWLTVMGLSIALMLLGAGGLAAWSARLDAWDAAEQSSTNLLLALTRDIGRNIAVFDLSLRGVQDALDQPGIDAVAPAIRQIALFDRAATAEDLGAILVADTQGKIHDSSKPFSAPLPDVATQDFFRVHLASPDVGLYLSRVLNGPICGDGPCVVLSRRLNGHDGRFAGVVWGTLRLSYLQRLFSQMTMGPSGTISLTRTDGRVIWRFPTHEDSLDRDLSAAPTFRTMLAQSGGRYIARSSLDGIERMHVFSKIDGAPLILSVNLALDDIYAHWRRRAAVIGPTLLVTSLAITALSLLFRREMLRRAAAEAALNLAAAKLTRLAETDALTGLGNRRALVREIKRLRHEAVQNRGPLSLLMLDADHFKEFNDRYGHLEGDSVLKQLADRIRSSLDPDIGFAARFGGEEFAVVLRCDAAAAAAVAETIRTAVSDLGLPHAGAEAGHVTVSVGVATCWPDNPRASQALLRAADEALYAAKRDGRNVVRGRIAARPQVATDALAA